MARSIGTPSEGNERPANRVQDFFANGNARKRTRRIGGDGAAEDVPYGVHVRGRSKEFSSERAPRGRTYDLERQLRMLQREFAVQQRELMDLRKIMAGQTAIPLAESGKPYYNPESPSFDGKTVAQSQSMEASDELLPLAPTHPQAPIAPQAPSAPKPSETIQDARAFDSTVSQIAELQRTVAASGTKLSTENAKKLTALYERLASMQPAVDEARARGMLSSLSHLREFTSDLVAQEAGIRTVEDFLQPSVSLMKKQMQQWVTELEQQKQGEDAQWSRHGLRGNYQESGAIVKLCRSLGNCPLNTKDIQPRHALALLRRVQKILQSEPAVGAYPIEDASHFESRRKALEQCIDHLESRTAQGMFTTRWRRSFDSFRKSLKNSPVKGVRIRSV